jgi:PAS domain S-box-containing protein
MTPKSTYEELEKENLALKQTVKNYRQLVQSANSIILRLDPMGNVRFINAFALKFFGYRESEIVGRNVIGSIVPPTASSGRNLAEMIADIGRHPERYVNNENENQRSNGEKVWVAWSNKGIADENGEIAEILCVGNDITQRRNAEESLRESEAKFRSVTEQSANMIFINQKGRVVYCNQKCEAVMGYSREAFCSPEFDFFTLIAPESIEIVRSAFQQHMAGREVEPHEYRLVTKDGDKLDVIITTSLIDYEGGSAILGMVTDITRRKKAEQALQESEAQFRALAESAPAAILILAGEQFLFVNPAFEAIAGYSKKEALNMNFWELIHPEMQELVRERGLARQRGEAVPERYELKALTKDGRSKWMDVAATVIDYGGQSATLAIAYDITKRKLVEDILRAREEELESKTRDLEEMNAALKVLLQKRDDDKLALEENMLSNVQQLIEPYLNNLKQTNLSARQANLLGIIETNMAEIISPFARDFTAVKFRLTPKEIQIANLVKQGRTNKDIAEIMGLSVRTIEFHRTKIRRKFGLKDGKDNLQAHLIAHD